MPVPWRARRLRCCRRWRSTCTFPGASRNVRTATSIRTRSRARRRSGLRTALIADLELALPQIWGRRVHSIFIGGGTPSLFSGRAIDAAARRSARECRWYPARKSRWKRIPAPSRRPSFRGLPRRGREPPVDRRPELQSRAVEGAGPHSRRRRGAARDRDRRWRIFDNVNLDLMYGLPRQTLRRRTADIDTALRLGAAHLSPISSRSNPTPCSTAIRRRCPTTRPPTCRTRSRAARARRLPALRDLGLRQAGPRVPAQPQLLALRRLPRHRRRRAFQALVRRPHRAPDALEAAAAVSRARGAGAAVQDEHRVSPGRLGFRIHAERAAADRGRTDCAVRRAHRVPLASVSARHRRRRRAAACSIRTRLLRARRLGRRFLNDLVALFLGNPMSSPAHRRKDAEVAPLVRIEATGIER